MKSKRTLKAERNMAKAVKYLVAHPAASIGGVVKNSGISWATAKKLVLARQTPVETLLKRGTEIVGKYTIQVDFPPAGVNMLNEALDVFEKRGKTYGDAATHWADVAALWTTLTGHSITAEQATSMMIGLKLLRLKSTPHHHDSIVDIAGYAAVKANVRAANGY